MIVVGEWHREGKVLVSPWMGTPGSLFRQRWSMNDDGYYAYIEEMPKFERHPYPLPDSFYSQFNREELSMEDPRLPDPLDVERERQLAESEPVFQQHMADANQVWQSHAPEGYVWLINLLAEGSELTLADLRQTYGHDNVTILIPAFDASDVPLEGFLAVYIKQEAMTDAN